MNLIKQHYEKFILGFLLLSFIGALAYLLNIVHSTDSDSSSDSVEDVKKLSITRENRPYRMQSESQEGMFDVASFKIDGQGRAGKGLIGYGKPGLMVPMKALRCRDCKKIIPWAQLRSGEIKCPFADCGQELTDPKDPEDFEKKLVNRDSDGDGLPDRFEMRCGLDAGNSNDANQDKDGDKYSNWFEYYCGSNLDDAKSVPSLDKLLFLSRTRPVQLPIELRDVVTRNPRDKNTYEIQVVINRQQVTMMYNSGKINLNGVKYRFVDAIKREKSIQGTSSSLRADDSTVYIMPEGSNDPKDRIEMRSGQKVFDRSTYTADLRDVRTPKRKIRIPLENSSATRNYMVVGDVFEIKGDGENPEIGKFKVKGIHEKSVDLEYTSGTGKTQNVTLDLINKENQLYQRLYTAYGTNNSGNNQETMNPEPQQAPRSRSRGRRN